VSKIGIIDLFCGTGGFAQGFLDADSRFCLKYAIDINPASCMTSRANHPEATVECGDIHAVDLSSLKEDRKIGNIDLIIGGPPCQGFSSLRPFRSNEEGDDRNNLYMQYARFVEFFNPRYFILENVVGLLTHDNGMTLEKVVGKFMSLGYRVDWRVFNAANFGVPQKRERFIMMGARENGQVSFPVPTHYYSGRTIGYSKKERHIVAKEDLPRAISVMDAIGDLPPLRSGEYADAYIKPPSNDYQAERRNGCDQLTLHKATKHSEKMLEVIRHSGSSIASLPPGMVTSGFSSCYSRLDADQPSTTITVKFQSPSSNKCIHPFQDRTLTPREAARIQSFDDRYLFCGSMTQIAEQIGNAVPPLLGKAIATEVSQLIY